jgi:TRAP-type uncharacterized transport system fused permease subunit
MYGMISGSPTADVVTTGSVTIPVMKRLGYRPGRSPARSRLRPPPAAASCRR